MTMSNTMHHTFMQFYLPRIDDVLFLSWWVGWTLSCVCQKGNSYTEVYDKVISQNINLAQLNAHPEMREDLIFNFRLTVSIAAGVPMQNVQVVNITAGSIHIAYKVGRLHKKFHQYLDWVKAFVHRQMACKRQQLQKNVLVSAPCRRSKCIVFASQSNQTSWQSWGHSQ